MIYSRELLHIFVDYFSPMESMKMPDLAAVLARALYTTCRLRLATALKIESGTTLTLFESYP